MLQAIVVKPGKIKFKDIPKPSLKKGEALIRVRNIGICGSDIHVFHGEHVYKVYPMVQGHEMSGEVAKVASDVDSIKKGERVTLRPQIVCGRCYNCREGNYHICDNLRVMGFQIPGTASEYFAAPVENIVSIPDGMSFEEGVMVEPVAVAVHALKKSNGVKNKRILVLGAGPIGNLVAQTGKALGAASVMITDKSEFRLKVASECNVDHCVNVMSDNLRKKILDKFGPEKADIILECVGAEKTIEEAIEIARKGTNIIIVGVTGKKSCVDMGLVQDRELKLIGTLMYNEQDFQDAIGLISKGRINVTRLITDRFPFIQYLEAFEYINKKRDEVMKVEIYLE